MSYTHKKRRKIDWLRLLGLILVTAAIFAVLFLGFKLITQERIPEEIRTENSGAKSIKKITSNYIIAAYYPSNDLKEQVEEIVEEFKLENASYVAETKEDKMILYVDYAQYDSGDYSSFELYKSVGKLTDLNSKEYCLSYCVDKKGNSVGLDDLFEGDYLKQLSALVRKTIEDSEYRESRDLYNFYHNTKAEKENFANFIIKGNNLKIYMDNSKLFKEDVDLLGIEVDLNKMDYFLKNDLNVETTIKKNDTNENHLRYIDPDLPMIALTYDDGPHYTCTNAILNVLEEYDSAATFFVVGNRIGTSFNENDYFDKGSVARAISMGMEIGNHTYDHEPLTMKTLSAEACLKEWEDCVACIQDVCPGYVVRTIRPTGGEVTDAMKSVAMCKMVNWSLDTNDWKYHDATYTEEHILEYVEDGDVILMHDVNPSYGTHTATASFVPKLIERGYQLVTVTELFDYKAIETEAGEVYKSAIK